MKLPNSNHKKSLLWGIDVGGTKIEGVIIDSSQQNRALHRLRVPTESPQGPEHIMR
ncbi:MAG: ROK family protein [Verrucomicrobia bacterium]|nr:MAG: ROK family protein [Verrucomicrobiota bacterium]